MVVTSLFAPSVAAADSVEDDAQPLSPSVVRIETLPRAQGEADLSPSLLLRIGERRVQMQAATVFDAAFWAKFGATAPVATGLGPSVGVASSVRWVPSGRLRLGAFGLVPNMSFDRDITGGPSRFRAAIALGTVGFAVPLGLPALSAHLEAAFGAMWMESSGAAADARVVYRAERFALAGGADAGVTLDLGRGLYVRGDVLAVASHTRPSMYVEDTRVGCVGALWWTPMASLGAVW
jgi:hypothetical protein